MRLSRRNAEAQERRRRRDDAPRLLDQVPRLRSLSLHIEERQGDSTVLDSVHVRRIAVADAPALFEFACLNPICTDGGHDSTGPILSELRRERMRFEGADACAGANGNTTCRRVLHYVAIAEYGSPEERETAETEPPR